MLWQFSCVPFGFLVAVIAMNMYFITARIALFSVADMDSRIFKNLTNWIREI